jgi:hypothetical protein
MKRGAALAPNVDPKRLRSMTRLSPPYVERKTKNVSLLQTQTSENIRSIVDMKKRIFAISLVLFMAPLALASVQSGPSAQKAIKTVSGEVMSVDSSKNEIVVKDDASKEVRLMVDKTTKITKEGKTVSLMEMKPSEKVTCECEESSSGYLAKSILVASMKSTQ